MVIFGDGCQTRDFTYVSDTARGILRAGLVEAAIGRTINLGFGREIAIGELARLVAEVADGADGQIVQELPRPGDTLRLYADITQARQFLHFEPRVTLREGLSQLKQWYLGFGKAPHDLLTDEVVHNWTLPARG